MLNNDYYLWGAGTYGGRIIDFMKGDLTFKAVIDNDPKKQGTVFHGVPVISYDEAKETLPDVKIVLAPALPNDLHKFLLDKGFVQNEDFYLSYQFVSRYYWAKDRLVIFIPNIVATTVCNMSCEACQAYIPIAKNHEHCDAEKIKSDIDLMFKHIDAIVNINFTCGESLLNSDAVADVCMHVYKKYAGRYNTLAIVTNGSVIPDDDAMRKFSGSKTVLSISDYPECAETKKMLIEKCNRFSVAWLNNVTCVKENWHDLGDPRVVVDANPQKLSSLGCWTTGVGLFDGWLYLCASQMWANVVAEVGDRKAGDAFDLRQQKTAASREELYQIISAQPKSGYVSHCERCNGVINPYNPEPRKK